ncbi:uncharacterized protein Triagg1_7671 [Trichoderma aggressivum f. europaeum]|uniref:NACHT domain-containing protein n=1 Tax=Trichoderma aggressivum f. europaeum TaxID=173218 RepID=A0AAE1I8U5_9HYPO|nr:hypothetical protein Triagg1_7671 [Trichoderma aggressivum f. europaeum]
MEALAAVGLASSIAQFLDFGVKVFNATREVAANGSGASVIHLSKMSADLEKIGTGLFEYYRPLEKKPLTTEERGLIEVAQQCRAISDEIQEYIAGLVLNQKTENPGSQAENSEAKEKDTGHSGTGVNKNGLVPVEANNEAGRHTDPSLEPQIRAAKESVRARLNRAKIALKTTWKKGEIEDLRKRHDDFRSQLALRLLFVLNTYQMRQSETLEDIRGKSDEIIEAVALHSQDCLANPDVMAAILTTRGSRQPTILAHPASVAAFPSSKLQPNNINVANSIHDDILKDTKWSQYQSSTNFTNEGTTGLAGFSTQATKDCSKVLLDALHFRGIYQRQEEISPVHAKTFNWILEPKKPGADDGLLEWLSQDSGCFWVSGKAGSGKSSLLKYVLGEKRFHDAVQTWACSRGDAQLSLGTFYFWYAGTPLQKSHIGLLRGLLFQILTARPGLDLRLFPDVCREILTDQIRGALDLSGVELKLAFSRLVDVIPADMRICFVVDGLDEYAGDLNELCDLFNQATQSSSIKILLSSRPIPVCCERFATCPQLCLQDLTGPDILKYVEDHLYSNSILNDMEEVEVGITAKLIDIITTRACGVFLWVVLVIRILTRQLQDYDSVPEMLQEINNLPADLEKLYDRMLGAIDSKYRVQSSKYLQLSILSLSFGEEYPMTAVQLYFAEDEDYDRVFSKPIKPLADRTIRWINKSIEGRLRSRCCGLLEVQRLDGGNQVHHEAYSVVGFLHRTVVEFLQLDPNWQKIQALTTDTKFDPEHALLSSALAELQLIPSPVSNEGYIEKKYHSGLTRLFIYEKNISEPLSQKFHQRYLPELDRLLPKSGVDDPLAGNSERDAIIRGSCDHGCSRLELDTRAKLFMRCAFSAPLWYLPVLMNIDHPSQQRVPREVYLLIHYIEEKDGLVRQHIVEALSVVKFSVSDPVQLAPQLAPLWTDRWHSSGAICWTPWTFVLRYIQAIITSWNPPDFFNFENPRIVLALLDLALLMLNLGADVKTNLIMKQDANSLLNHLLSAIHFNAQFYSDRYGLYREEIFRKCDDVQRHLTHEQSREVHESLEQSSEVPDVPYNQPLVLQLEGVGTWQWVTSWVSWIR